ncbi:hypothetical protein V498_08295 [Pseudogymnoascus sp. VKM F-4517 (FW-2822)]|nr:hypothetical protein V498_08295 [Pseudogymnoascus sp. VKM F-4517 (FW-2822)]
MQPPPPPNPPQPKTDNTTNTTNTPLPTPAPQIQNQATTGSAILEAQLSSPSSERCCGRRVTTITQSIRGGVTRDAHPMHKIQLTGERSWDGVVCGAERISRGRRELGGGSVGRPSGVGVADDDGGGTWEWLFVQNSSHDAHGGVTAAQPASKPAANKQKTNTNT